MENPSSSNSQNNLDLVWGARAIGAVINRDRRQAFHLLETGQIPARKVGGRWCASRAKLAAFLLGDEEAA